MIYNIIWYITSHSVYIYIYIISYHIILNRSTLYFTTLHNILSSSAVSNHIISYNYMLRLMIWLYYDLNIVDHILYVSQMTYCLLVIIYHVYHQIFDKQWCICYIFHFTCCKAYVQKCIKAYIIYFGYCCMLNTIITSDIL